MKQRKKRVREGNTAAKQKQDHTSPPPRKARTIDPLFVPETGRKNRRRRRRLLILSAHGMHP
jgi:hypothetical protein